MSVAFKKIKSRVRGTVAALICIAFAISAARLYLIDFKLDFLVPTEVFHVELNQKVDGYGDDIVLRTYLPSNDQRQRIFDERQKADGFSHEMIFRDGNRRLKFSGNKVKGPKSAQYSFRVLTKAIRFSLPEQLQLGDSIPVPESISREYLHPTKNIQSEHPEVRTVAERLVPPNRSLRDYLHNVFDYVQSMDFRPFKGTTDALTALRLKEASCNGRARLFVALMRCRKIPARLVGGLVMNSGTKKTSHQWLEVWTSGYWVPMDPTNHHFAEIPHHYLKLYVGDKVLFQHTADVAFDYWFSIKRKLLPPQEVDKRYRVLGFWNAFSQLGIPLDLLKILIMIPLGALVVLIFRNVVGLRTYGTFLPALIAVAARNTGIGWGLIGFCMIIVLVSGVRRLLQKLELLHSPQLTVLLTAVIGSLLLLSALGIHFGFNDLSRMSLFPVAILALTSERFTVMEIEDGRISAYLTMLQTIVVVSMCYIAMDSLTFQLLFLALPELLLVVAAMAVLLGRWTGLRLSEWIRFWGLLRREA